MSASFLGYVLAWGQLSFWGGTVVSNIFSICNITTFICGRSMISSPTVKRFFIFHFIIPFIIGVLSVVHICYLHLICSSNTLGFYTNNLITFYPFIVLKDILGLVILGIGYTLQILTVFGLSHPDNSLEVNGLITPLHIVPEWYFLHLYMVLKAIPNKTSGLILFITSVMNLSIFNEVKNITTISRLTSYINWIYGNLFIIYILFITLLTFFIGVQLPQNLFLSYGRVLKFCTYIIY